MEKYPCLSNRFFNHTEKFTQTIIKNTHLVNPSTSGKVNLVDFPSTKIEFTPLAFQLFPEEKAREPRTSFSKDFGSVHGALV